MHVQLSATSHVRTKKEELLFGILRLLPPSQDRMSQHLLMLGFSVLKFQGKTKKKHKIPWFLISFPAFATLFLREKGWSSACGLLPSFAWPLQPRNHGALAGCFSLELRLKCNWLVVLTILKNICQWEGLSHILWKIKNIPNHPPGNMGYTTNGCTRVKYPLWFE